MKNHEQAFHDGEVIFREGDASRSAYVLVSGRVELTKAGERGSVTIAILDPGETFGEMGVLDQGPRSATARAVGAVVVRIVPGEDFLASVRADPDAALRVMGRLVARLRNANERLVRGSGVGAAASREVPLRPAAGGLLRRLLGIAPRSEGKPARAEPIQVRIALLGGDEGSVRAKEVVQALGHKRGLRAKSLKKVLEVGEGSAPPVAAARQWLSEEEADLLVWGQVSEGGTTIELGFVPALPEDEDRPGAFALVLPLHLPAGFAAPLGDVLHAASLAAVTPADEGKTLALREALPGAVQAAMAATAALPEDLTSREKATVQACVGNAAAALARLGGAVDGYQVAAQHYRAALEVLTSHEDRFQRAILQRNLGAVLQALAERGGDADILGRAADLYRESLKVLTRAQHPREWAAVQNRLGTVLYRQDQGSGGLDLVKGALAAFQAALQVYTRADAPLRWAEVMNNFAQAAQVLGGELRSAEVLEKAVEACRGVLEVRRREAMPLLWAATQNNLGSALFLLGRLTRETQHLDGAAEAFRQAHDLYATFGAQRMVAITERNLAHVQKVLAHRQPRAGPREALGDDDFEPPLAADDVPPAAGA